MNNTEQDQPTSLEEQPSPASPSPDLVTTAPGKQGERKKRAQAPKVESAGSLLRATYEGKFKRATLTKAELSAMRSAPFLDATEKDQLTSLANLDRTLSRTRQLMLLAIGLEAVGISGRVIDFAREVLQRHPAFGSKLLAGVLEHLPDALIEDEAVEALAAQNFASLTWPAGNKPMNRKESQQCKVNAIHCLLLLFRATRGTSVERIQLHLQTGLWEPVTRRHKSEAQKLRTLITTRDVSAASITYGLMTRQVAEQSHRAENARRSQERAAARAVQLEEELANISKKLTATQAEADSLASELLMARQAHENYKTQAKNDYEQLRGQVLRRLNEELALLDDGLHALQRDPPKVHVMLDHAERAIAGLKREVERLREKGMR